MLGPARTLVGHLVNLRAATSADLPVIGTVLADSAVIEWWGRHDGPEIRTELRDRTVVTLLVGWNDNVIGIVQCHEEAHPDYRHAGMDIALVGAHHGTGAGLDAMRVTIDWLTGDLEHHRVVIDPRADNLRAIAAYRKVGFRDVGLMHRYERGPDGIWRDGLLMELIVGEPL